MKANAPATSARPANALLSAPCRRLVLVLGDQLDDDSAVFDGFDPSRDRIWMAEVAGEATHVWNSQSRIAIFLASMRHFRDRLRARGWPVAYRELQTTSATWTLEPLPDRPVPKPPPSSGPDDGGETLAGQLRSALGHLRPSEVHAVDPGEWRLRRELQEVAAAAGIPWVSRPDRHFICTPEEFARHARGRKQLRLEYFYREQRQRTGLLMDGDQPLGGQWNYDAENRESFGREGPGFVPVPKAFPRTPSPVGSSTWCGNASARTRERWTGSTGRSPRPMRRPRWTTSSNTGCRNSAAGKMPCGRANPGCTIHASARR